MSPIGARPFLALLAGSLGIGAGYLTALVLGSAMAPFSIDQPIRPADLFEWAGRWGLLLGSFSAAAATLGRPRPASPAQILRAELLAVAALVGLALAAGLLAALAVRAGWAGREWLLPSRSGYALRLGGTTAAELLGLPIAAGVALGLWRDRLGVARQSSGRRPLLP